MPGSWQSFNFSVHLLLLCNKLPQTHYSVFWLLLYLGELSIILVPTCQESRHTLMHPLLMSSVHKGCDHASLCWIQLGMDLLPSSYGWLQNPTSLQLQERGLWLFANYGLEAAWSSEPRGPLCRPLTTRLPANSRPAKNLSLPPVPMESYTTKRSWERQPTTFDSLG